jgi:hypothetical protein
VGKKHLLYLPVLFRPNLIRGPGPGKLLLVPSSRLACLALPLSALGRNLLPRASARKNDSGGGLMGSTGQGGAAAA